MATTGVEVVPKVVCFRQLTLASPRAESESGAGAPLLRVVGNALQRGAPGTLVEAAPPLDAWMRGPQHSLVRRVVVGEDADAADDWIAGHIGADDIVVTNDIPLAARCLDRRARALRPDGNPFSEDSIGMAMATRDIMAHLRDAGEITGGPPAFTKKDRSRFLNALEAMIQATLRDSK